MKKFNSIWAILVLFFGITSSALAQLKAPTVVGDVLFTTDFNTTPSAFTSGDYDILAVGATVQDKLVNTITFNNGANKQRIHIKTTQAVATTGDYSIDTPDDAGATTGDISFITSTTGSGGGYFILPAVQGPCNISVWACTGNTTAQKYDVYFIEGTGTPVLNASTSVVGTRRIKKNTYKYEGSGSLTVKIVSSNVNSSSSTNLLFFNVTIVQAAPPTVPALDFISGAIAQSVYPGQAITPISYKWSGTATSASVAWTGTADAATPPAGVTVASDATAKTITISGLISTAGAYGYSVSSSDATNVSTPLTGTLTGKTTTKYKLAYVTSVANGAPAALDVAFTTALGNDNFDMNYISSASTGVDYSFYDLIVLSAIPSSADAGIADLKTSCLSKPFVNMKTYQLQSTRWNWLTPANNTTLNTITVPDSAKIHPLFSGITMTGSSNNEIQLTTATSGNMVVTAAWLATSTASANPKVLATAQAVPAGYCYMEIPVGTTMNGMSSPTLAKQVILGLSEASWASITADAVKIAVNAAKYVVAPVPTISLTSGSNAQTLHANASIANVVYTYGGTVTATNVVWTGTANSSTPPAGITFVVDAVAKTITFSGAPTAEGVYGYKVSATDGAVIPALTGTFTVSIGTGVASTFNAKTVATKEFFDVTGKKVSEFSHGLLIEKTIYSDGTISFNKIYRAEF